MCWVNGNSGCFVSGKFGFDASHPEFFFPKTCLQPKKDVFTMSFNVLQDAFWTSVRRLLDRNCWAYGKKPSVGPMERNLQLGLGWLQSLAPLKIARHFNSWPTDITSLAQQSPSK